MYDIYIYTKFAWRFGARRADGGLQCPLGRQVGLPARPAGPAWASVLPVLAYRASVGRQLNVKWTPSERQVNAKLDSWTAKTTASVDVRLKDAKTAAMSY